MTVTPTLEYLKTMRLRAMAEELKKQTEEPASFSQLGFEERIALIVDAEWNLRQTNKLKRYINTARFAAPGAAVEDIEYFEDRHLDKAQMLRFATCKYIDDGRHIILRGTLFTRFYNIHLDFQSFLCYNIYVLRHYSAFTYCRFKRQRRKS